MFSVVSIETTSGFLHAGSGGFPSAVRVGVSVGTPLLLLILITAVVSLVMAVLRLRKTKNSLQRRLTERE